MLRQGQTMVPAYRLPEADLTTAIADGIESNGDRYMRVAIGYFQKHFLMTDIEIAACRQAVVHCATAQRCELAALIDEIDTALEALHEALHAVMELDDRVLIVPNLLHFAGSGNPMEFRQGLGPPDPGRCPRLPSRSGGRAEEMPSLQYLAPRGTFTNTVAG